MKKEMQWLAMLAGLCLTAACSSDEDIKPNEDNSNLVHITFTAGHNSTRTAINASDSKQIDWQKDDTLSILDGSGTPRTFKLTSGAGDMVGTFDGMANETDVYTAVYPQRTNLTLNGNSVEGMVLDSVQTATEGTFDPKANLMMARTTKDDLDLQFYNATAFIKVTPEMDCEQISIVNADSTQALAGTMTVTLDGNTISTKITAGGTHMVSLMGDIKAGKTYYIAVAPDTLKNGFRLGFTTAEGKHYHKDASKSVTLTPNKVLNLGKISVEDKDWLPYVTFSAKEEQGVTLNLSLDAPLSTLDKMEYSIDYGKHWASIGIQDTKNFGKDKRLMLRGNNDKGTCKINASDGVNYVRISFTQDSKVYSVGDIRTLAFAEDYNSKTGNAVRYYGLFTGASQLVSAPELPDKILADRCYACMFQGCSNLTTAPKLTARVLKPSCYAYMFMNCDSLTSVTMFAEEGTDATECMYGWLAGAGKNGGTVIVAKGMSSDTNITENVIPFGWKVEEEQ